MNKAEMNYEYNDAVEKLEAAARRYNEEIERAQQEQRDANGQDSQ